MEQWVFRVFGLTLLAQLVLAVFVYVDAHRLKLKYPLIYLSVAMTPVVGVLISLAYLFERRSLPEWSAGETAAPGESRSRLKTEIAYVAGIVALFVGIGVVRSVVGS